MNDHGWVHVFGSSTVITQLIWSRLTRVYRSVTLTSGVDPMKPTR